MPGVGPERASQITRCGSMLRAGMRVSFHSDFMMAPPEPLLLAWCAANRFTRSGAVASPTERLSLEQALRGITIDAAWALGMEAEIGSIACGKRADFAVLEDDPFELGVERLKDVRVAGTVFEGTPHWLARPVASLHASLSAADPEQWATGPTNPESGSTARSVKFSRPTSVPDTHGVYRRLRTPNAACCGPGIDRCDLIRQWPQWLSPQDFSSGVSP